MKKLTLHRETLRRISSIETDDVVGGIRPTWTCGHTEQCLPTTPYKGCDTMDTTTCLD